MRFPHHVLYNSRPARGGFTVLELLTVLTIIAIVSTAVIGAGRYASESSKAARARAELAVIASALDLYRATLGDFPKTDDGALFVQALLGRRDPTMRVISTKPFLETHRLTFSRGADPVLAPDALLIDPWDRPYRYVCRPGAGGARRFVLYSVGPDGADYFPASSSGWPDPARPENADNILAGEGR